MKEIHNFLQNENLTVLSGKRVPATEGFSEDILGRLAFQHQKTPIQTYWGNFPLSFQQLKIPTQRHWGDFPSNPGRCQCRDTGETSLPESEDTNADILGKLALQQLKIPMQRHWGDFRSSPFCTDLQIQMRGTALCWCTNQHISQSLSVPSNHLPFHLSKIFV